MTHVEILVVKRFLDLIKYKIDFSCNSISFYKILQKECQYKQEDHCVKKEKQLRMVQLEENIAQSMINVQFVMNHYIVHKYIIYHVDIHFTQVV